MPQLPAIIEQKRPKVSPEYDYSTLSNYKDVKVLNTTLDIEIQFQEKKIAGNVKYNLSVLKSFSKLVIDSSYIKIHGVKVNDTTVKYSIRDRVDPWGSAIDIESPAKEGDSISLSVDFETTEKSTAIQWLKTNPSTSDASDYVFTQLEPNHARALFPCFDTPAVKSTVDATIKSKHPVVFSGLPTTNTPDVFQYEQKIPIPAYLFAIASGNIAHVKAGPRSTIYAEPDRLEDARNEFEEDLEKFIQIAEKLTTPYIWSTYDILINPASFPYGGMENPNITFVTPTLISYDKSQVDVIAHELAHSWSGNNVTNASWEHFWLNEGWTVYLERRIVGELHGEQTRQFHFIMGWNDLQGAINELPKFEYSRLVQDLQQGKIDPDDTFSSVPYEKGSNFIYHLECKLGGVAEFDPFIKHYFTKFSKQSIDTYQFVDALFEFYANDQKKIDALNSVDWNLWLYTPGLPPRADFDTTLVDQVTSLVDQWVEKATVLKTFDEFASVFGTGENRKTYDSFSSPQKIFFIDHLLEKRPTPTFWKDNSAASDALISIYSDLTETRNTEIIFRWFKLKLLAGKKHFYQDLADWLGTVGRMKYVRPSYRLLNTVDHDLAVATFEKFKERYHPIASNLVKKDLGL